jgi:hypothetical protein
MKSGYMYYGSRKYNTLFLVKVDSLHPETAARLLDFVSSGGTIFCLESIPSVSLGYSNFQEKDREVERLVGKMKACSDRFFLLKKPEKDFIGWYKGIQEKHMIKPYLKIEKPDPFVMQNRYQGEDGTEVIYLINSHIHNSYKTRITFSGELISGKNCWKWDPETGNRFRVRLDKNDSMVLDLGPAESFLFVFNSASKGEEWQSLPASGSSELCLSEKWTAEFVHCRDGSVKSAELSTLRDLKDMPEFVNFAGTVKYTNRIRIGILPQKSYLNLGKVYGLCSVKLNGVDLGIKWYGRRIYDISKHIKEGNNDIEILVVTSMGNYMKSLTDNPVAQYWTNEKNKVQPLQSMGLIGPVTLY